jgi:hypothetical protein
MHPDKNSKAIGIWSIFAISNSLNLPTSGIDIEQGIPQSELGLITVCRRLNFSHCSILLQKSSGGFWACFVLQQRAI